MFQQTKPTVHKLLGARMYNPCVKRPKLKPTDRRPTLNVTAASVDELTCSTCDSSVYLPQTIDDMRRMQNREVQNSKQTLKPYIGKRTAVIEEKNYQSTSTIPEQCHTASEASTAVICNVPTNRSAVDCDTTGIQARSVQCSSSGHSSNTKTFDREKSEATHCADSNCLPKEKLLQYLDAVA